MRRKYLIIFIFVLLFVELPLAYIYYTGQERITTKYMERIDLSEKLVVSRENSKYMSLIMEKNTIYQIVVSSSNKINMKITDLDGFLEWQRNPDEYKPLQNYYQVDKLDFTFVPKETKDYYFIFETDPLLFVNVSVNLEISSTYKEIIREDILNTIEPILKATSIITILLFILSILPKGGISRKNFGSTYFVLTDEAKSHDIAYLKEFRGFSEKEINILRVISSKGHVTKRDIPRLFDIPSFYKLYKMGFIKKTTEL